MDTLHEKQVYANIRTPEWKRYDISLGENKTTGDLKAIVCERGGLDPDQHQLLYCGKYVPHASILGDYADKNYIEAFLVSSKPISDLSAKNFKDLPSYIQRDLQSLEKNWDELTVNSRMDLFFSTLEAEYLYCLTFHYLGSGESVKKIQIKKSELDNQANVISLNGQINIDDHYRKMLLQWKDRIQNNPSDLEPAMMLIAIPISKIVDKKVEILDCNTLCYATSNGIVTRVPGPQYDRKKANARRVDEFAKLLQPSLSKNFLPFAEPTPFWSEKQTPLKSASFQEKQIPSKSNTPAEAAGPLQHITLPETLLQYLSFEKKPLREAMASKLKVSRIGPGDYWIAISEKERECIWSEWKQLDLAVPQATAVTEEEHFVKKGWSELTPEQQQSVKNYLQPGSYWGSLADHEKRQIYKTWLAGQGQKPNAQSSTLQNKQPLFFPGNKSNTEQPVDNNEDSWSYDVD